MANKADGSFNDNTLSQNNDKVKLPTKYSMQESQNNTQGLENSSFSMNSKGKKLSKGQQEYFKDSKVRDENGNLQVMYHGTRNDFTIFDINKSGESSKQAKVGFWFTENSDAAKNFANSVWYGKNEHAKSMEVYLNIKNPKIYDKVDNSQQIKEIKNKIEPLDNQKKEFDKKYRIDIFSGDNDFQKIVGYYNNKYNNYTDSDMLSIIKDITFSKDAEQYLKDVKEYNNITNQLNALYKEENNLKYDDSYEQFRGDIYKHAGMNMDDANFGGTGKYIENENEIMQKYINDLKEQGYDGIIIKNTDYDTNTMGEHNNQYVAFYPEQIKNIDNVNPTKSPDIRYSQNNDTWQEHLEKNYKATGTRTYFKDILLPTKENIKSDIKLSKRNDITTEDVKLSQNKILNPLEISNLTKENANTTPKLPKKGTVTGEGKSKFYENATEKSKFLKEDVRNLLKNEEDIRYYKEITNKDTLEKAYRKLQDGGSSETLNWFNRNGYDESGKFKYKPTTEDVAEGWILMKQYQDAKTMMV